jgi:type I restriction enzyme S subunit
VPWSVYESQSKRCGYKATDVVFARKGRLGFARPYGDAKKVFSHTVVIIKPRRGAAIAEFLLWVVRDDQFLRRITERMNSNSGVPTLGVQFLSAIPVLVPQPPEQQRIAQTLSRSEAAMELEQRSLTKLHCLKVALMQDLLTGRRRVTDLLASQPGREKVYASQ